jgi:sulfopyruvate decarboxylase beta subunit
MIAESIIQALKDAGVNLLTILPCEKARRLGDLVSADFEHIALSREEEGVGISAGAYLAGARPAMLIQSSGIGNMVNALCSLIKTYELPLLILASWRGVYREEIPAQVPLGKRLPKILAALDVDYSIIETRNDVQVVSQVAAEVYARNKVHVILLSPKLWEGEENVEESCKNQLKIIREKTEKGHFLRRSINPAMTRFEILKISGPFLDGKIVVCNLGVPCKELYHLEHQKSNFYMLGSMGLASSIGLGISSFTQKEVVVIDGDGSLFMNLGALSTIAVVRPRNLTILAIDNGVHGSTGNQLTATSYGADLELIARGAGFVKTYKVATEPQILSTIKNLSEGPNFIHILARPGNAKVPNIPLTPKRIKQNVMETIKE